MPVIIRNGSLTTGTTLNPNNIWAGSQFEYLRRPSLVSMAVITAGSAGGLLSGVSIGPNLIAEEYLVPFQDPAVWGTSFPAIPDAFHIQDAGVGGDRLANTLRNPTGGTLGYAAYALIVERG